jgi:hypothetical protein
MSMSDATGEIQRAGRPPLLTLLSYLAGLDGVLTLVVALLRVGREGAVWWDSLLALLLGSFLLVAAAGLLTGRPWGRWTGTGAFGLALLLQLWSLGLPVAQGEPVRAVTLSLRGLAVALLVSVVVYLNIRPATEWFRPRRSGGER